MLELSILVVAWLPSVQLRMLWYPSAPSTLFQAIRQLLYFALFHLANRQSPGFFKATVIRTVSEAAL